MSDQTFSLQPFPSTELLPNLKIAGNIARYNNELSLTYAIIGDLQKIIIPTPSETPDRKQELWQDTCLEFFIGTHDSQRYWEFNLSPNGDWNIYRFDSYRQEMEEETAFATLPFTVHSTPDSLTLALGVNLDALSITPTEQSLKIGITAVVKHIDGKVSYWALTHEGKEADFHLPSSFVIEL